MAGLGRIAVALAVFVTVGAAAFVALAWREAIDPIDPPHSSQFPAAMVTKGAALAAVGNCDVCHSKPGGETLAGGLPLPTPFGTIYSTNLTPDPDTGIGRWSETAFIRAMREGVDRAGHHLYPAFPYDHFTKITEEDDKALYAFLMTRKPVQATAPANELPFPLNIRLVLAGWKLLFFKAGSYQPDPAQSNVWNRGAYLAEGLGHCGACHTPRNILGAEIKNRQFAGGEAEGWSAYALNAASPAPVAWTAESLAHYLRNGWEEHHGVARGPMAPVTANMRAVPDEDVEAIATYISSVMGEASPERQATRRRSLDLSTAHAPGDRAQTAGAQTVPAAPGASDAGAAIYAATCSSCHDAGRPVPYGGLPLALSTAMHGPTPMNPINVILFGLPAADGERGPIMPGFAAALNDDQIAALLAYMRAQFSDQPAWDNPRKMIGEIRRGQKDTDIRALNVGSAAPANATKRETTW